VEIQQEIDMASGKIRFRLGPAMSFILTRFVLIFIRYWKDPGAMNEYIHLGGLGRFEGFLACIIGAAFVIAGPEYISMTAGEAKNPRKSMPKAFNSITYRLVGFFIIGALSVGIVCPYTSDQLLGSAGPYAAASPYIISMEILKVKIFPSIVNALILTSILSAANGYVFSK
jgi:amino acid transporter